MNRVLARFLLAASGFVALLLGGCAAPTQSTDGGSTVIVAVRMPDGGSPSPPQVARVYQAITPAMTRAGLRFADGMNQADYVLTATFTPDPTDPNGGSVTVNGIVRRSNQDVSAQKLKEQQEKLRELDAWASSRAAPDPR